MWEDNNADFCRPVKNLTHEITFHRYQQKKKQEKAVMKRFVQLPRLNQIRFLRSTAVLKGCSESNEQGQLCSFFDSASKPLYFE